MSIFLRYSEFYALESKLTEFHGEFEDAKLPAKAKLFWGKGLDVMQSKKKVNFEQIKLDLVPSNKFNVFASSRLKTT